MLGMGIFMAKKVELLAPAGTYEAFLAAIENGADAVYLGGKQLNARQFAGNFADEELERALDYAHVRGARILLTMNTLVLDSELQGAVEYAGRAWEMGVDAFIVQDMGFAEMLRKAIPEIKLHASTQMTIYDINGVRMLENLGFERVVLARELSLKEIEHVCKNTKLEIETFVHGALCVCYSGQCLMSSMIGGRSGNRGKCAQPCRLPYAITQDDKKVTSGYLLSPKDICYVNQLAELVAAGVSSLKIEGRMKSPEYVASVVSIYRKYLDFIAYKEQPGNQPVSKEDMHALLQSFNRGGFSKGYLLGKTGPEMMAYEKPKNWGTYLGTVLAQDISTNSLKLKLEAGLGMGDGIEVWSRNTFKESPGGIITKIVKDGKLVRQTQPGDVVWVSVVKGNVEKGSKVYKTSDKEMLEMASASYAKSTRKTDITAEFTLKFGQTPVLTLKDDQGNIARAEGNQLPEKAISRPLSEERIQEQLLKMGSTPFKISAITIDVDSDITIPVSELNNIRRTAAEILENKRIKSAKREISKNTRIHFPGNSRNENKKVKISALLYHCSETVELSRINADRIYLPFAALMSRSVKAKAQKQRDVGKEIYMYLPASIKGKYTQLVEKNMKALSAYIDGLLVGNIGIINLIREKLNLGSIPIMGDYSLNITNSASLLAYRDMGLQGATLSYELNVDQLEALSFPEGFETELGVYGKIPVMTSEYCPVGGSVGKKAPDSCGRVCSKGVYTLADRKGAVFPVKCDCVDCRSTLFNSNTLFAPDLLKQIMKSGVGAVRLSFVDEKDEEIYRISELHRALVENRKMPEQEQLIEEIRNKGFTRGHLMDKGF